jgi:hypothetical protein
LRASARVKALIQLPFLLCDSVLRDVALEDVDVDHHPGHFIGAQREEATAHYLGDLIDTIGLSRAIPIDYGVESAV